MHDSNWIIWQFRFRKQKREKKKKGENKIPFRFFVYFFFTTAQRIDDNDQTIFYVFMTKWITYEVISLEILTKFEHKLFFLTNFICDLYSSIDFIIVEKQNEDKKKWFEIYAWISMWITVNRCVTSLERIESLFEKKKKKYKFFLFNLITQLNVMHSIWISFFWIVLNHNWEMQINSWICYSSILAASMSYKSFCVRYVFVSLFWNLFQNHCNSQRIICWLSNRL